MCREAARLGCYGFDLIDPADWPTLRKHGLEPLLAGAGPVTFENGIIHPEVHDAARDRRFAPHIDMCAEQGVKTIITIGGQRRGMPYEQGADNAVAFLNRIKGQLEDRSVTIAIENMNNRRTRSALRPRGSDLRPLGVGRRRLRARQFAEREARLRSLSPADHGRRHRAEHSRYDPVDRALPHRRCAVAQRDRLQRRR